MTMTDPQVTASAVALPGFTCSGRALLAAVKIAERAVCKRGALVLSGLRVSADETGVSVTGTDLDLTMSAKIADAVVTSPGVAVVPSAMLKKLVSPCTTAAKDRPVTFGMVDVDEARVSAGKTTVTLRTLPADEWPRFKGLEPVGDAVMTVATFADVLAAAGTEDHRPIITGVLFEDQAIVTTDSYRLHMVDDLPPIGAESPFLVPARALREIVRLKAETVAMSWGHWEVVFYGDGWEIRSRLIEGEFPRYRSLLPAAPPIRVTFDPTELVAGVKEVAALTETDTVRLVIGEDTAELVTSTQGVGEASYRVPVALEGPGNGLTVGFNTRYLPDLLAGWDGPATLEVTDANKPAVARQPAHGGTRVRLLMPVRI